jgi:CheY-like chemotaxis protein/anti-sigma regulatory factor (Ser/Thr protein kinase)
MRASVEALRILLDGLLDISKLDAGGIEPVIIASPISPLLAPLASEYRPRLHAKGLLMRVVDSSVWLRTDPQLLGRILRNLLDNALKYTPQGTVLVGCRRHGDHVSIEVVDTGIGIPSSQLNLIWEEFFQADNPSRDRRKGLGLGLAIVRGLARLLGHTVSVQSREGHGSIFSVDVPLAPQQEFHAAPLHLFDAKRTEGVVAVVDDEAMVLDSLCTVLGLAGYKDVICASDTAGLVDSLSKAHVIPDVIVADYRLKQGHTGIEAVKAVRAFVHRAVPAIIVSGDTTPELLEATRANRLRLMNKPIQAQELVAAIATAVSEGAAAQDVPARIGTNTL